MQSFEGKCRAGTHRVVGAMVSCLPLCLGCNRVLGCDKFPLGKLIEKRVSERESAAMWYGVVM